MNKSFLFLAIILIAYTASLLSAQHPPGSLTYQNTNGNRYVSGKGNLPAAAPLEIKLRGIPQWIVSGADGSDLLIAVALNDGSVQAFRIEGNSYSEITSELNMESLGSAPPVLVNHSGELSLLPNPRNLQSHNHPLKLRDGNMVYIDSRKDLVIGSEVLRINPLSDGRILTDEKGRLLLLTDPTNRYGHGVLGDRIEAGSFTLIETDPRVTISNRIVIDGQAVIEGIMPIWTDIDKDGNREILVTISDRVSGARLVLFDEKGKVLARGPAIGTGFRWRNQLAVAPFGPHGEMEIVDTHTPHIGGPVEFFRWEGDRLTLVASVRGFTSHVMGSRNLDMALAGDFDGNGTVEIIVPSFDRRELGAIERTGRGAQVAYRLELGARLITNLSALVSENGDLGMAAGNDDGILRIWLP